MTTLTDLFKVLEDAKDKGSEEAQPDMPVNIRLLRDFSYFQGATDMISVMTKRSEAGPSREEFAAEIKDLQTYLTESRADSLSKGLIELIEKDPVRGFLLFARFVQSAKDRGMNVDHIFEKARTAAKL